ncbi:MAG: zinc carboxypeptidase, partial [Bacteroidota bacterium]
MKSLRFTLVHFLFLCVAVAHGQQIKSPNEFLPHRVGDKFTPHHMLNDYFRYLANATPATMKLVNYGLTNEDRPLQIAIISSPENMARLE